MRNIAQKLAENKRKMEKEYKEKSASLIQANADLEKHTKEQNEKFEAEKK